MSSTGFLESFKPLISLNSTLLVVSWLSCFSFICFNKEKISLLEITESTCVVLPVACVVLGLGLIGFFGGGMPLLGVVVDGGVKIEEVLGAEDILNRVG